MQPSGEDPFYFLTKAPNPGEMLKKSLDIIDSLLEYIINANPHQNSSFIKFCDETLSHFYEILISLEKKLTSSSNDLESIKKENSSKDDINDIYMSYCLNFMYEMLAELKEHLLNLSSISKNSIKKSENLLRRLKYGFQELEFAIKIPKDKELFLMSPEDPSLKEFVKLIKVRNLDTPENLDKMFNNMMKMIYAVIATGYAMKDKPRTISSTLLEQMYMLYYMVAPEKAKLHADISSSIEGEHLYKLMHDFDKIYLERGIGLLSPSIAFAENFFIPRNYPEVTSRIVEEAVQNGLWNDPERMFFSSEEFASVGKKVLNFEQIRQKTPNSVEIRLLFPCKLPKQGELSPIDTIIIHIHGGGFVTMSAKTHDNYTRKWANSTKSAVFSINYRLAPQNQYPASLDDAWQAYNWIIDNSEKVFGIKPKKVVTVGDSAGANLNMALNLLLVKNKRRKPDGVLMIYPTFSMEKGLFSPSDFTGIKNIFLSKSFGRTVRRAYLGPKYTHGDPLISGSIASDDLLKDLPRMKFVLTGRDILHDDGIKVGFKMFELGKKIDIVVYKGVTHGILNYDFPVFGLKEARTIVNETADMLKELLL